MIFHIKGKIIKILLLLLLLAGELSYSQNTLDYYLNAAFANNPELKENEGMAAKTDIRGNIIKAEYRQPQVYFTGDIFYPPMYPDKNDPDAIGYDIAITDGGLYSTLLNVRQPVFNKSVLETNNLKLETEKRIYLEKSKLTKHELEKQVTEKYIIAYKYLSQIGFNENIMNLLEQQRTIIKSLAEKGILQQSDLMLINIAIQNMIIEITDLRSAYERNLGDLNELCGLPNIIVKELTVPDIFPEFGNKQSLFLNRFVLDSLQAVYNLDVANLRYKPQLNFYASTGINAIEIPGIQRKFGAGFGVNLIIPIYDGHQKKLAGQETAIDIGIIDNYKQNFIIRKETRLEAILNDIKNIDDKIMAYKLQSNNYESLIELYKAKLNTGQINMMDYLNILKSYLTLKNELALSETNKLLIINENNYYNW